MRHFIAAFFPAREHPGGYSVLFPDLPGCGTQGNTFDEAFDMAQEALEGFLDALYADGDPIPEPSDFATARALARAWCEEVDEPMPEDTLFQAVPAPPGTTVPVRINISLAPHILARIDRVAKAEGLSRSGLLATAARHYIHTLSSDDASA